MTSNNQQNFISRFCLWLGLPLAFSSISTGQVAQLLLIVIFSLFAASSAHMLGIALTIPSGIVRLFNEQTMLHTGSGLTILLLIGAAIFKLSRLIVIGLYFQWTFLKAKFCAAPRFTRGLRDPVLIRYQAFQNRRLLKKFRRPIAIGQIAIAVLATWFLFLSFSDGKFVAHFYQVSLTLLILFAVPLAFLGVMGLCCTNRLMGFTI